MPPFHSQQIMPVPAPTAPSATGPAVAPSTAARTSSGEIWVRRASLSQESSHSPTMGMVTTSRPTDGSSSASSSTTASQARPTCIVDVSRIGVSSTPHSRTWIAEVSSPAPLSTATPAARPLRTTSPSGPGTMAVTPVRATPAPRRRIGLLPPDGGVADEDARHVGDGVARPGRQQADLDAQVPGPGAWRRCRHRPDCTQPPARWLLARARLARATEPRQIPMGAGSRYRAARWGSCACRSSGRRPPTPIASTPACGAA